MKIEGDAAQHYRPVYLDSLRDVIHPKAKLISGDDATGEVNWRDHVTDEFCSASYGPHRFRFVRR